MAPRTKDTTVPNDELEHTAGGATTRDGMDAGVPMTPGQPDEPVGPEDAMGVGPTRGKYDDRIDAGPHLAVRAIPAAERWERARELAKAGLADGEDLTDGHIRNALGDVPAIELADQTADAGLVGDLPGKGGVSTAPALEAATADANAARVAAGVQAPPAAIPPADADKTDE